MRRKLFTIAAGASAVVFVAVCVLWVRSYSAVDAITYRWALQDGRSQAVRLVLERGGWMYGRMDASGEVFESLNIPSGWSHISPSPPADVTLGNSFWSSVGFSRRVYRSTGSLAPVTPLNSEWITFPCWILAGIVGVL